MAYLKSRTALAAGETTLDPRFREAVKNGDLAGAGDAALDHVPFIGDGRSFKQNVKEGNYGVAALNVVGAGLEWLGARNAAKQTLSQGVKGAGNVARQLEAQGVKQLEKQVVREVVGEGAGKVAKESTQQIKSLNATAKKVFNPKDFKGVSKSFLNKTDISDIHKFKAEWLGTDKGLKLFDVVKHTETNELLIIRKSTQEVVERTYMIVK